MTEKNKKNGKLELFTALVTGHQKPILPIPEQDDDKELNRRCFVQPVSPSCIVGCFACT